MNDNNHEYDDLTVIDGIGPALQTWLREELEVRTYEDLSNKTVDEIKARLLADADAKDDKGKKRTWMKAVANSNDMEKWLKRAEELAAESKEESEAATDGPGADDQPDSPKKAGEWEQYATFVVDFEVCTINGEHVKRINVGQTLPVPPANRKFYYILSEANFEWMLEQAGEEPAPEKSEPAIAEPPKSEEVGPAATKVKVTGIQLFQPPSAKKPLATNNGKPTKKQIKANKPFALQVFFSLVGEGAESIAKQKAAYIARAVADETETKAGTDLGSSEPEALVKGKLDYSIKIPEATLEAGEHRLWAVVRVQAPNAVPSFLEGPLVKVV